MRLTGERIVLRRPLIKDAAAIFENYAADEETIHFMAWPVHETLEDTKAFLRTSNAMWKRYGFGPLIIEDRATGTLMGSAGFMPHDDEVVDTGYVLAKQYWGKGFATEALRTSIEGARDRGIGRLRADIHPAHIASRNVVRKCGFRPDPDQSTSACVFPQIDSDTPQVTVRYILDLEADGR